MFLICSFTNYNLYLIFTYTLEFRFKICRCSDMTMTKFSYLLFIPEKKCLLIVAYIFF